MLSRKKYLAYQAILVSILEILLDKLCVILHGLLKDYKVFFPAISVIVAYYIISSIPIKSLEQKRCERAEKDLLKLINERLKNNISETEKQDLEQLRSEVISNSLKRYKDYLEICENDLKQSLKE